MTTTKDMQQTIQALKRAVDVPLSVIIVGVGAADFSSMDELDDDDGKLGFKRDLVQFVPFRSYANQPLTKLAKDTLAEVPKQVRHFSPRTTAKGMLTSNSFFFFLLLQLLDYMNQKGIKPRGWAHKQK
jgi:hypothetical protein